MILSNNWEKTTIDGINETDKINRDILLQEPVNEVGNSRALVI